MSEKINPLNIASELKKVGANANVQALREQRNEALDQVAELTAERASLQFLNDAWQKMHAEVVAEREALKKQAELLRSNLTATNDTLTTMSNELCRAKSDLKTAEHNLSRANSQLEKASGNKASPAAAVSAKAKMSTPRKVKAATAE